MDNDKQLTEIITLEKFDKIINSYKIKIYEQKIIIDCLKDRLYNEEMIKRTYKHELFLKSKL